MRVISLVTIFSNSLQYPCMIKTESDSFVFLAHDASCNDTCIYLRYIQVPKLLTFSITYIYVTLSMSIKVNKRVHFMRVKKRQIFYMFSLAICITQTQIRHQSKYY